MSNFIEKFSYKSPQELLCQFMDTYFPKRESQKFKMILFSVNTSSNGVYIWNKL